MKDLRIMSQNLLGTDTEYPNYVKNPKWAERITVDLTEHTIEKRHPRFLALLEKYKPDSIGVQECSTHWRKRLSDGSLEKIGYARVGADKHEKIGVIYNTTTVRLVESSSIWLTEKPDELDLSVEWRESPDDRLIERLGMYALLEVIETGERYIHFNTHIDLPWNKIIQTKQVGVLLSYIKEIREKHGNPPAFLTGDFNFNYNSEAYAALIDGGIIDSAKASKVRDGISSFNKLIGPDYAPLPIDYVVGTDDVEYRKHTVAYDKFDDFFVSDHYAVCADVTIN